MNHKNVNDIIAFTDRKLLDEAIKRYHTAEDSLLYYKYPRKTRSRTERECLKNKLKKHTLFSNKTKYPNYVKTTTELEAKNNLSTRKSIFIQKVKAKSLENNCTTHSPNKELETTKEEQCLNETYRSICHENNHSVSTRIKYPNYVKTSSKLKEISESRLISNGTNSEKSPSQNNDIKNQCDNPYLHIKDIQVDLQRVMEENEKLKSRLKGIAESLRKTLINCDETDNEIKPMKCETGFENKQSEYQNDGFTFTLMDHCNGIKDTVSFEQAQKKLNQTTNLQPLEDQMVLLKDVLDISANESVLEKIQNPELKRCLVQLEKQNRMIIHSLNELKQKLKKADELQSKNLESSSNKKPHFVVSNRKKTSIFPKSVEPPAIVERKTLVSSKSEVNQSQMLREMIKFIKLGKDKDINRIKDNSFINLLTNSSKNDHSDQSKQVMEETRFLFPISGI